MSQPNNPTDESITALSPSGFAKQMIVDQAHDKMRLDVYLSKVMELSRQHAKRLIQQNLVYLNGHPVPRKAKAMLVHAGSQVTLKIFDVITPNADLQVPLLHTADGFVIVNKPAGMPVHPLNMAQTKTVLNKLVSQYPQLQNIGESGLKSGVVHRLDVQTSGALIVAIEQEAWEKLRQLFETRTLKKTYRALVYGQLKGQKHQSAYLQITQHQPAKVRVDEKPLSSAARCCELTWQVLENFNRTTLIEVDLHTGFLHQIRAMFADLGHPIVGDTFYGPSNAHRHAPRQMLHASRLAFDDIDINAPDPEDFCKHLNQLRN